VYVGTSGTLEVTLCNDAAAIPVQGPGNTAATWTFTSYGWITIANHGFTTGQYVMVAGGTLPTGLSTGVGYFVIVINANTIALATSAANATAGTAITLSGTSATCRVYRTWQVSGNTVIIPGHGFVSGDRAMVYSDTTLATGIAAQTAYYIAVVDANTIEFATSYANAIAATPTVITLSGSPAGIFSVFKSTLISSASVGYHSLCCQRVNAASTALLVVGLY